MNATCQQALPIHQPRRSLRWCGGRKGSFNECASSSVTRMRTFGTRAGPATLLPNDFEVEKQFQAKFAILTITVCVNESYGCI